MKGLEACCQTCETANSSRRHRSRLGSFRRSHQSQQRFAVIFHQATLDAPRSAVDPIFQRRQKEPRRRVPYASMGTAGKQQRRAMPHVEICCVMQCGERAPCIENHENVAEGSNARGIQVFALAAMGRYEGTRLEKPLQDARSAARRRGATILSPTTHERRFPFSGSIFYIPYLLAYCISVALSFRFGSGG